jgi:Kef-type K+ transport system membrane component KefB/nucleotide-binding universal stress UspA family protein
MDSSCYNFPLGAVFRKFLMSNLPFTNPVLVFALILGIILFSPIIFKRLHIPALISLIISGLVVGPHGFNLLEKNLAIDLLSTTGVLYIMFLAGLELDLNEFKKNKHKSLFLGILLFIIPITIGFPLYYYLLEFDINASLLVASLFATQTLVAYPVLSKLGVSKNQAVAITLGATLITDIAVLFLLTYITGSLNGSIEIGFWIKLIVSLLLLVLVVGFIFPVLARWFFKNTESEKTSHFVFVLTLMLFAGYLAQLAGVEPIVGAFIAGLSLNPLIPRASILMNRIEFVGASIFIPIFLISVGMLVDVKVIFSGPESLTIAMTFMMINILSKWIPAYVTQKVFKYSDEQRDVIFGLSLAHAAVVLAVIIIGYKLDLVNESILNGTIILILFSCLMSSFVTEGAGKKLAIIEEDNSKQLIPNNQNNEKILVHIEDPAEMEKLVDFALLVKNKNLDQEISVLSVVQDDDNLDSQIIESEKMLQKIIEHGVMTDDRVKVITRIDLNDVTAILRVSKELIATMIIFSCDQKTSSSGKIFGSSTNRILENTWQTIFVLKLLYPINTCKRLIVIVPPNAEYEKGFHYWLEKLGTMSKELTSQIIFYCSGKSKAAIKVVLEEKKINMEHKFLSFEESHKYDDLVDFLDSNRDDILIIIGARLGTVSYSNFVELIPPKIIKHYSPSNSFILIYPEQEQDYYFKA